MAKLYANNFSTTLNGAILLSDTTITLTSVTGFPAVGGGDTCQLTLDDGTNIEIVTATAISGSDVTITRAQEGTSAVGFADGTPVELRLTANALNIENLADSGISSPSANDVLQYSLGAWANVAFSTFEGSLTHDNLSGVDANQHIDWTSTSSNFNTSGTITGSSGAVDFNAATSLRIPQSATPTISSDGHIGVDTTVTGFNNGVLKFYGGEEQGVISMPISEFTSPTNGHFPMFEGSTGKFEMQFINPGEGINIQKFIGSVEISGENATDTNKGICSFNATDFTVSSGNVTLNSERVQDITGAMVTGNTETGITVTYEDGDGTLDFVVADTTVAGDSGSTGITPGDTLTIAGGTNIETAMSGDTLTINTADTVKNENLIIGGDFSINPWQRGTSFVSPGASAFLADRIEFTRANTAEVTVTKASDAPTQAEAGYLSSHCLSVDVTTADATNDATNNSRVSYKVEGYDFRKIAQKEFTLSFWHKHTKTGTNCVAFRNSGNDRTYIAEYTQSVSDTWEKATITVPASPSAGTWDYENGSGIEIIFIMMAGSNFHGTSGSWLSSGSLIATSSQVNNMDSDSNFCRFALIQLEEGGEATSFNTKSFADTLRHCQRYYVRIDADSHNIYSSGAHCRSTAQVKIGIVLPQRMRAVATASASATSAFAIENATGTPADSSAITFQNGRVEGYEVRINRTGSGLVAGNAATVYINSGEYIEFDAEL